MGKKLIRPTDISNIYNQQDELIPSIVNGNCVLIVGSEIMLSKEEFPEYNGDSYKMIFENLKEWLIEEQIIGKDHKAQTFTQLAKDVNNIDRPLKDILGNEEYFKVEEMPQSLVQLIETKYFRTVLTTTFDPYIYNLMRKVWGDELRVMNINSNKWENDFDFENEVDKDSLSPLPPTLYYVFGKGFPNTQSTRFAITDNDYIEVLAKWMGKSAPQKLLNYIHSKRILALGCKFDDWFFRFFWYLMRGSVQGLTNGEVAISLNPQESETDSKLKEYFEFGNIHFEPDARAFIKNTLNLLKEHKQSEALKITNTRRQGEIFLSYAHEDFDIVKKIFYRLVNSGFRVWFDAKELNGGNDYDKEIPIAISNCKIFIPILSSQVQHDLQNDNQRFYKDTEWNIAQTHANTSDLKILPIKIWGYNERSEDNIQKLPQCLKKSVFDLENTPITSLIETIKSILNN
ncbi:MAG: toll/interleukin-1 receptor domain-containing protein [Bacteroidales bacterium]|nr:toll/interleukin-1 receptor domain-containing protein [Bacteroidales bacterium]